MSADRPHAPPREFLRTAAAALVLTVLYLQARAPLWWNHLSGDLAIYDMRVTAFLNHKSLAGTEYQPGALFFFVIPKMMIGIPYGDGVFIVMAALLVLHLSFLRDVAGIESWWIGLGLFMAAGPVFFFRFDLFVSLLVLLSLYAWQRDRAAWAGTLLGCATMVKLYPLLLAPFLLRRPHAPHGWQVRSVVSGFACAVGFLLIAFFAAGGSAADLVDTLMYHVRKPVSIESTPGTIAVALGYVFGRLPRMVYENITYGVVLHGVVRQLASLGTAASLGVLYWLLWRFPDRFLGAGRIFLICHVAVLSLLVWSSLYIPQYILWVLGFTALLPLSGMPRDRALLVVALYAAALAMEQYVFPTHFSDLLTMMQGGRALPSVVAAMVLGKVALIAGYVEIWREVLRPFKPPQR